MRRVTVTSVLCPALATTTISGSCTHNASCIMSRRINNNVRGPTSALTDFLRVCLPPRQPQFVLIAHATPIQESGITPTTIARRARTRNQDQPQDQPAAGPSAAAPDEDQTAANDTHVEGAEVSTLVPANHPNLLTLLQDGENYDSDNLDESEEEVPAPKKRKLSKAAEAKLKAKDKAKAKKKAKKEDDDDDYEDSDDDPYNALSKMWKSDMPKPPIGSFAKCAKCRTQFTVVRPHIVTRGVAAPTVRVVCRRSIRSLRIHRQGGSAIHAQNRAALTHSRIRRSWDRGSGRFWVMASGR